MYFFHVSWQIPYEMEELADSLKSAGSVHEKIALLDAHPKVRECLGKSPRLLEGMSLECQAAGKQIIAIGQWERLAGPILPERESLRKLLEKMVLVDSFYQELGGIAGYQEKILQFLHEKGEKASEIAAFHAPAFIDIIQETDAVRQAIAWGIEALPDMAEMYPLGGAADRLHLVDEQTKLELPAAKLEYAGRTLFESLIRDLASREYLYYKLYGKRLKTPVAIMTSEEKDNHRHVLRLCEERGWFGRSKELFRFFIQPLVPAVDKQGNWCLLGPLSPLLKPGGHGALWKLARDQGVFEWLVRQGKQKTLIRQINNPIASIDYGLLAFAGIGIKKKMVFGFASCPRLVHSAEGVNVVVEKKNGNIALTNIEYCDFAKYGIEDAPLQEGGAYSRFSSNTNILFADLREVEQAVSVCPFPGLLINLKTSSYTTFSGEKKEESMARLESTMQNIADVFAESSRGKGSKLATERTFVTYNHRHKTISTAKKAYIPGSSPQETPEECFYVQMQAARELLELCRFDLPPKRSLEEYLIQGPEVAFLYHPGLGPLYSLIVQKIIGGRLALGAELELEIAELQLEHLDVEGSLRVLASQPLGHFDSEGLLCYSHRTGRCVLKNAAVRNEGVDWRASQPFWKHAFRRKGGLEIRLHGFSEFVAEDVVFSGSHVFEVPEGVRMKVRERNGKWEIEREPLREDPFWAYRWNERQRILAARV